MRRLSPLLLLGMLLLLMLGMLLLMLGMLLLLMPVRWRQSISDHGSLRRRGEGWRAVVRVSRRDLLALWLMSRLIARPIRLWRCVGGVSSTYLLLLRRRLLVSRSVRCGLSQTLTDSHRLFGGFVRRSPMAIPEAM